MSAQETRSHHIVSRFCNARSRKHGTRCRRHPMIGERRCYLHGGIYRVGSHKRNTGPANSTYRVRLAMYRALGISWHGGAPRKPERTRSLAEEAKAVLLPVIREIEASLPAEVMTRELDTLSPAETLGRAALSGLRQIVRIVEQPLPELDAHPDAYKHQRLIGDMSLAGAKLYMKAQTAAFTAAQGNALVELLAALNGKSVDGKD